MQPAPLETYLEALYKIKIPRTLKEALQLPEVAY
jgi:hypothetical protein